MPTTNKVQTMRQRFERRVPALRGIGRVWNVADKIQTGQGIWHWARPVRAVLTWIIAAVVGAVGGANLFFVVVNQIPTVDVPKSWPVVLPVMGGFGLAAWAITVLYQGKRITSDRAVSYDILAMDEQGNDSTRNVASENLDGPEVLRPGFVEKFGMLWHIRHVARRATPIETLSAGIFGTDARPTFVRIEGPYCPNDYERLQLRDANGYRQMAEGDDINSAGSPYCPTCGFCARPEPNYRAARLVSTLRQMVRDEYPYDA